MILRGGISQETTDILEMIAKACDFMEDQHFAPIHKVILGLSNGTLEDEILQHSADIDVLDSYGRTALGWAAARGDEKAVMVLLSHGADPNTEKQHFNTPLCLAASQNHTACVRSLLEAGALPDPPVPKGVRFGTPLSCAARYADDPLLLRTLLEFGANPEAIGVDGVTPLIHVARGNSAKHALVLLQYGANINAESSSGQTPLLAAISHNNHGVLKLLHEYRFEIAHLGSKGADLLQLIAQDADIQTMSILATTNYLRVNFAWTHSYQSYVDILQQRVDSSEKLAASFKRILSALEQPPIPPDSKVASMEYGALPLTDFYQEQADPNGADIVFNEKFYDCAESIPRVVEDVG